MSHRRMRDPRFRRSQVEGILVPVVDQMQDRVGSPNGTTYLDDQRANYDGFVAGGGQLWMYTSCDSDGCTGTTEQKSDPYYVGWPGYLIDEPMSEARAMGWLCYIYHASGELYYSVSENLPTAWTDQFKDGGNGDGTLFYPGTTDIIGGDRPIPIESMRLKYIRDGYEDYEYLRKLDTLGLGAQADSTARALFGSTYDTNRSGLAVALARGELASLIQGALGAPAP